MAKLAPNFSPDVVKRVVAAAWDEPSPYTGVQLEFAISKGELVALMKRELSSNAYKEWSARAKAIKAPTVKARFPYGR